MRQLERSEQIALFRWAELSRNKYPELALMFAVANGGSRHKLEAYNLKLSGVRPGVPDICLPVARHGYNSLFIEMKSAKGKATLPQQVMIQELTAYGNSCHVCKSFEEAKSVIEWYLGQ